MKIKTVDELRRRRAEKLPMFHVEYLPYAGSSLARGHTGHEDDIYTTREEAKARFDEVIRSTNAEEVTLSETIYPRTGGSARRQLDEWYDKGARGAPNQQRGRRATTRATTRSTTRASTVRAPRNRQTSQPRWKLVYSTDYSALFTDETGQYAPEMMIAQEIDDAPARERFQVYRFPIERLKIVKSAGNPYLVNERWDASWPHPLPQYQEWFAKDLGRVAESSGRTRNDLVRALVSADPRERASAYEDIGNYHGFDNFDSYPQTWSESKMNKEWP